MRALQSFMVAALMTTAGWTFTDAAERVDLLLVLAADVSNSMEESKFHLQRVGYDTALSDQRVIAAIRAGPSGRIAVAFVEWSGILQQKIVIDWTVISNDETARQFGDRIMEAPRAFSKNSTSISAGIDFAMTQLDRAPYDARRRVIDVSGDGTNNSGERIVPVRDEVIESGITINGLPIMLKRPTPGSMDIENLDVYYEDCVIGGPGAFVIPIHERDQFKTATRSKLVLEIAGRTPALRVIPVAASAPRISCTIGERMWRERWGD